MRIKCTLTVVFVICCGELAVMIVICRSQLARHRHPRVPRLTWQPWHCLHTGEERLQQFPDTAAFLELLAHLNDAPALGAHPLPEQDAAVGLFCRVVRLADSIGALSGAVSTPRPGDFLRSLTGSPLLQANIFVARAPGRLDVMGGIAVRSS